MNIEARIAPRQVTVKKRAMTATELNPVYASPQYHRYPQPAPERYLMTTQTDENTPHTDIDYEKISYEYGNSISTIVSAALGIYNEIQQVEAYLLGVDRPRQLNAAQVGEYRGLINARQQDLNGLCEAAGNYLDIRDLVHAQFYVNAREMSLG